MATNWGAPTLKKTLWPWQLETNCQADAMPLLSLRGLPSAQRQRSSQHFPRSSHHFRPASKFFDIQGRAATFHKARRLS
eukprot:2575726-Amphidinium_carterae.1